MGRHDAVIAHGLAADGVGGLPLRPGRGPFSGRLMTTRRGPAWMAASSSAASSAQGASSRWSSCIFSRSGRFSAGPGTWDPANHVRRRFPAAWTLSPSRSSMRPTTPAARRLAARVRASRSRAAMTGFRPKRVTETRCRQQQRVLAQAGGGVDGGGRTFQPLQPRSLHQHLAVQGVGPQPGSMAVKSPAGRDRPAPDRGRRDSGRQSCPTRGFRHGHTQLRRQSRASAFRSGAQDQICLFGQETISICFFLHYNRGAMEFQSGKSARHFA